MRRTVHDLIYRYSNHSMNTETFDALDLRILIVFFLDVLVFFCIMTTYWVNKNICNVNKMYATVLAFAFMIISLRTIATKILYKMFKDKEP